MEPLLTAFSQFGFGAVIVWFLFYLVTRAMPAQMEVYQRELTRERKMYLKLLTEEREIRNRADAATVAAILHLTEVVQRGEKEYATVLRELHEKAMDRLNVGFEQLADADQDLRVLLEEQVRDPTAALRRRRRREPPADPPPAKP